MPRAPKPLLPQRQCNGPGIGADGRPDEATQCPNLVRQTRPTLDEDAGHYCPRKECQRARARDYQAKKRKSDSRQMDIWLEQFIHELVSKPRLHCHGCGLVDGLPGWPHRDRTGQPCRALITVPGRKIQARFIDAVWPSPTYKETLS